MASILSSYLRDTTLEKAVIGAERKPKNADEFNPTATGFGNSCRATVDRFPGWNVALEEHPEKSVLRSVANSRGLPSGTHVFFKPELPGSHPRRVVLLCDSHVLMSE